MTDVEIVKKAMMNELEALEAACRNPDCEAVDLLAYADYLEERGGDGFVYRWMAWHDRRPAYRTGERIRNHWGWYKADGYWSPIDRTRPEYQRYLKHTKAHLHGLLGNLLTGATPNLKVYDTWDMAVRDLASVLRSMQDALAPPKGK